MTKETISGRVGFVVYLTNKRKWKLFGSEVQEQSVVCHGGLAWYGDVVVFPCRVQDRNDEVTTDTCTPYLD